jgi:hypothetical protein
VSQEPKGPIRETRFFEGVDRLDFGSLGGRLIPCVLGIGTTPIAVDLAWRVWWWDSSDPPMPGADGVASWGIVPVDDDAAQALRELEQWKRLAPMALRALQAILPADTEDRADALLRLEIIQETLLTVWGVADHWPVWRYAFLYRSLTLDGRWLLTDQVVPVFDVKLFRTMLEIQWGKPIPADIRKILAQDPRTRIMPELFVDAPASIISPGLRLIPGGLPGSKLRCEARP